MRPLRLMFEGFGSYREHTDVQLSDVDFFVLTGPTGSGKSTVIDALCFALYGTVPRWGKRNAIRNALAPSVNEGKVCLVFEAVGRPVRGGAAAAPRPRRATCTTKEARLDRLDDERAARRRPGQDPRGGRRADGRGRQGHRRGLGAARHRLRAVHPVRRAAAGPLRRVPAGQARRPAGPADPAARLRRLRGRRPARAGPGDRRGRQARDGRAAPRRAGHGHRRRDRRGHPPGRRPRGPGVHCGRRGRGDGRAAGEVDRGERGGRKTVEEQLARACGRCAGPATWSTCPPASPPPTRRSAAASRRGWPRRSRRPRRTPPAPSLPEHAELSRWRDAHARSASLAGRLARAREVAATAAEGRAGPPRREVTAAEQALRRRRGRAGAPRTGRTARSRSPPTWPRASRARCAASRCTTCPTTRCRPTSTPPAPP